jgi:hypothetical protein
MELSNRNRPFVVKILIGWHKLAKTLINNGASLNMMMRKTFIEMGLNLVELTPVHDTFHRIIAGQSSTPIGHINLEMSCGSGENKHKETLTFEVASFDIRYNCILGRPFLLKFMAVVHTVYATIKMPGPKGVITLKFDQRDALACEDVALTYAGRFSEKETQELVAKVAKTHGGSTPVITLAPKLPTGGTLRPPVEKKSTFVGSTSNQPTADQAADDKKKGVADKEVAVDPDDTEKKLRLNAELDAKWELTLITFLRENMNVFAWQISDMPGIPREVIEHKLVIDSVFKLIKQKERRYRPERRETIRVEVNKLHEVEFIRPVDYPIWLANLILVEKPDGY